MMPAQINTHRTSANAEQSTPRYTMKISRMTVDKLGVKLYDRVSAVIAELVANSYDADATEVVVTAPMGQLLATRTQGVIYDKGYFITVEDNGIGMSPEEMNNFYLRVGAERRRDPRRGDRSKKLNRKVMGRKGVGKLAPFGICEEVEIISSGGGPTEGIDRDGNPATGFATAHLTLHRSEILSDEDADYRPTVGALDGLITPSTGTKITLRIFNHRSVPNLDEFCRQLAQRFGLSSQNWKINLRDLINQNGDTGDVKEVGTFSVDKMPHTEVRFDLMPGHEHPTALDSSGNPIPDLQAGFSLNDVFYPVQGWVAYSKENYKDDLMAGVRIYCHNKIASQTALFDLKSGFTGEYDMRSYFVGELHADWLDEQDDDLIQTDRKDILWSHELGEAFQLWGQELVKRVGRMGRNPMKDTVWQVFRTTSLVEDKIAEAFPGDEFQAMREDALDLAKMIGRSMRTAEAGDPEQVEKVVQMSLFLAPHVTLSDEMKQAADASTSAFDVIAGFLKTARVAELSSYGRIAYERIQVIKKIETLKNASDTNEAAMQETISDCPWLIDPRWSPITANQTFSTLKREFAAFYRTRTGVDIIINDFSMPAKRADFVLSDQNGVIQIIEIKKPNHRLEDEELKRIVNYVTMMREFLSAPNHAVFRDNFRGFHVVLVCDGTALSPVEMEALNGLKENESLEEIDWSSFLTRTKTLHQAFLDEADRQMKFRTVQPPNGSTG